MYFLVYIVTNVASDSYCLGLLSVLYRLVSVYGLYSLECAYRLIYSWVLFPAYIALSVLSDLYRLEGAFWIMLS